MLKIIKCKPMLNHIITTANVYEESQINGGVIDDEGKLEGKFKEYQTVIAVGPHVRDVQVGDLVIINPSAYCKPRHKTKADSIKGLMGEDEVEMIVEFPIIDINGEPHLFLFDRDIDLIIEEKEFINDSLDENKDIIE
jgi:hypothetical protein